jgi:peptidoglycan/LPS O-acetylase OafA/YrhL
LSDRSTFRADLEGLRAVAVMLVLAYHARVPGIRGGYTGVDVFFVLSGFLITGLLIRELSSSGRVNLPAFYARRARRLLPAAALTLLVTMAASMLVMPPLRVPDIAGDVEAAALYVSNLRFAVQATDYLASSLAPSPVLHFWSLGVEEQFYLFWPALLALASGAAFAGGRARNGLRRVSVVLAVVFGGSLALSLWLTDAAQPWAFFSLPARAWELALGGLLALPAAGRLVPERLAPLLGWIGLGMIMAAGVMLDDATLFPGTAALLPTVGAALVIASGLRPQAAAVAGEPSETRLGVRLRGLPTAAWPIPGTILSLAPLRFLGRISYSLYLWHWPILVLPAVAVGHNLSGLQRVALALLSIVVATASQRWVEDPIRRGRIVGLATRRSLGLAGVVSLVVAISAMSMSAVATARLEAAPGPDVAGSILDVPLPPDPTSTAPSLVPGASGPPPSAQPSPTALPTLPATPVPANLVPSLANARNDLPVLYADGCHVDAGTTRPGTCVFGDPASSTTVVLFGDSHAAQWFPALERLSREQGWRLIALTKSACSSADLTVWSGLFKRAYTECDTWREAAFARIAAEHPALVITSNSGRYQPIVDGAPVAVGARNDLWFAALGRTLTRLSQTSNAVLLIGETPRSSTDPPVCLSAHLDDATACATPYAKAVDATLLQGDARVAASAGVRFVDPTTLVCRSDPCPVVIGPLLIYRDEHHLTATYVRALATRLLPMLPALGS